MDTEDYSVLLDLMFPAIDFSNPQLLEPTPPKPLLTPHHPSIASQQYPPTNQQPSPPCYEPSRGPTPPRQRSTPLEVPVVGRPPGTSDDIWNYIKILEDRSYMCLWKKPSGGVCRFSSSLDQLKKHMKRKHYVLKWVASYGTPLSL